MANKEAAILDRMLALVRRHGEMIPEQIYAGLFQVGIDSLCATKAICLVPVALGRHLIEALEQPLTDFFFHFTANGELILACRLSCEPIYRAAAELAPSGLDAQVFESLALASPEVQAVSFALSQGSSAFDMLSLPLVTFAEMPTAQALILAQRVLASFSPDEPAVPVST